jgi:exosome complex RNA-binding protein Rrp42 (RNase PH superfamily)
MRNNLVLQKGWRLDDRAADEARILASAVSISVDYLTQTNGLRDVLS